MPPEVLIIPRATAHAAAERLLHRAWEPDPPVFLITDGEPDRLHPLVDAVAAAAGAGMAIAAGAPAQTLAAAVARRAIRRRAGVDLRAPLARDRALSGAALRIAVPFAPGDGLEVSAAVDVARAGFAIAEIDLPTHHSNSLAAVVRAYLRRP